MNKQKGAILAVCLVLLALLALLTVAGMESLLLHGRMETNMRLSRVGFAAAEAALREAEAEIDRQCPVAQQSASALWPQTAAIDREWWQTNGAESSFAGAAEAPRFFAEARFGAELEPDGAATVYYRITARGSGGADASVLQVFGVAICDGEQTNARDRLSWRQIR